MNHLISFVLIIMAMAGFASNNTPTSGIAQTSMPTVSQASADEFDDLVDAAELLSHFKAFVNSDWEIEGSEFAQFLINQGYKGPKEYAFEESRSAETVWYKNCTLKKNVPRPQTFAKGTTSIVSLEMTMGGGLTLYLTVFNDKAANQIKRQVKQLNLKVSERYDSPDAPDVCIFYDHTNKCWTMYCNQFCDFISGDEDNQF